jgi:hypothetical protein
LLAIAGGFILAFFILTLLPEIIAAIIKCGNAALWCIGIAVIAIVFFACLTSFFELIEPLLRLVDPVFLSVAIFSLIGLYIIYLIFSSIRRALKTRARKNRLQVRYVKMYPKLILYPIGFALITLSIFASFYIWKMM